LFTSTANPSQDQRDLSLCLRALRPSSTTDDIPRLAFPNPIDILPRVTSRATNPASTGVYDPSRVFFSPPVPRAADVTMTESVTITFSQTGVQPPVYVVTSMSEQPWEPLEMSVEEEQTASANLIFTRQFKDVAEGDHQYKIRVGDGHWVVDESTDSGTLNRSTKPRNHKANTAQPLMSMATATTSSTSSPPKTETRT
jgi:hypothetical protein